MNFTLITVSKYSNKEQKKLKTLGKRIAQLRKAAGKTQTDVGAALDSDYSSMSRIENGRINPTFLTLSAIAEYLNVSMYELTEGAPNDNKSEED